MAQRLYGFHCFLDFLDRQINASVQGYHRFSTMKPQERLNKKVRILSPAKLHTWLQVAISIERIKTESVRVTVRRN